MSWAADALVVCLSTSKPVPVLLRFSFSAVALHCHLELQVLDLCNSDPDIFGCCLWVVFCTCFSSGWCDSTASSIALLVAMTKPGASFWSQIVVKFSIAYWSLSISLNSLLTLLIAGRLLFVRNRIETSLGTHHAKPYSSLVAMLVESAALYSVTGLIFIISYAQGSPFQNLVLPPLGQIQVTILNFNPWSIPLNDTWRSRELRLCSSCFVSPKAGHGLNHPSRTQIKAQ